MRFPELYIERQRLNEEMWEKVEDFGSEEFFAYQTVLWTSSSIINSIPPNDWGLEDGTLIYLTGDTGQKPRMFRINRNKIESHDRKDYWFSESILTAHNLVTLIRSGRVMILQETVPSFDNWEEGL